MSEAELQAVLTNLTQLDFQDAFKKWQKCWERRIPTKRDYSRVTVGSRPKVSF
jgi:hypothetical protein